MAMSRVRKMVPRSHPWWAWGFIMHGLGHDGEPQCSLGDTVPECHHSTVSSWGGETRLSQVFYYWNQWSHDNMEFQVFHPGPLTNEKLSAVIQLENSRWLRLCQPQGITVPQIPQIFYVFTWIKSVKVLLFFPRKKFCFILALCFYLILDQSFSLSILLWNCYTKFRKGWRYV